MPTTSLDVEPNKLVMKIKVFITQRQTPPDPEVDPLIPQTQKYTPPNPEEDTNTHLQKIRLEIQFLWVIHTAWGREGYKDRYWDQELWVSTLCYVLYTLHRDRELVLSSVPVPVRVLLSCSVCEPLHL